MILSTRNKAFQFQSQILMSEKLAAEVIRALEKEHISPFRVFVDEECLLMFGTPLNNLLADVILLTQELGKKLAFAFAKERLVENGAKFHEALAKTKLPSFKKTDESVTAQKNNKQRIVEVNIDILRWLVNLSASSGIVVNHEKAMQYSLRQSP